MLRSDRSRRPQPETGSVPRVAGGHEGLERALKFQFERDVNMPLASCLLKLGLVFPEVLEQELFRVAPGGTAARWPRERSSRTATSWPRSSSCFATTDPM